MPSKIKRKYECISFGFWFSFEIWPRFPPHPSIVCYCFFSHSPSGFLYAVTVLIKIKSVEDKKNKKISGSHWSSLFSFFCSRRVAPFHKKASSESSLFRHAIDPCQKKKKKPKKNKKTPFNCLRFHKQFWGKSISILVFSRYTSLLLRRKRHDGKKLSLFYMRARAHAYIHVNIYIMYMVCVCMSAQCVLINIRRFTETFPKSNKTLAPGIFSRIRVNIFIQFKFKPLEWSFSPSAPPNNVYICVYKSR